MRTIVVHGHFYQPPRADPWLELIARDPVTVPDHDWNARINRQCYASLAGVAPEASHVDTNLFATLSFNVGATLFEWLEPEAPTVYAAILAADRESLARSGHGNAIAMPYHHIILPLATRRDKVTEVRWGIADFRRRFGRPPEGMWLPETAVDDETLDVLAAEGIRFTILAPHQVEDPPADGSPLAVQTSGGRSIAVFAYDGALAGEVAFSPLLTDWTGAALATRLSGGDSAGANPGAGDVITAVATDGETFGHHYQDGARALAGAVARLRDRRDIRIENFATILDRVPARPNGRIRPDTSWSCSHGIERWRSDCDCRVGAPTPGDRRWRAPLRNALNWLAAQVHETFEREGAPLFTDPWGARQRYGTVVARDGDVLRDYAKQELSRSAPPDSATLVRARELLEAERAALRMFGSCAWFFDEVTGVETRLALRLAAHAIQLAHIEARRSEFLERLTGDDQSGAPAVALVPDGAAERVRAQSQVTAGFSGVRKFAPQLRASRIGCYDAERSAGESVSLVNRRTGRGDSVAVPAGATEPTERESEFVRLARAIGVPPA